MEAIQGRKDYFLEKRRKVKAEEPVEDEEWEKPAKAGAAAAANGGPKAGAKQDGLSDIHDWPGGARAGNLPVLPSPHPLCAKSG